MIRERRIDLGIASSMAPPPGVRRLPWCELSLALLASEAVTRAGHEGSALAALVGPGAAAEGRSGVPEGEPVGSDPSHRSGELANAPLPFVLSTPGSLRSLTEQVLAQAGIEPRVVAEADSLEVVKRLVLDGFGRALIPAANVTEEDRAAGLQVTPLPAHTPRLPVVFWLRDTPHPPPSVHNFLALATEGFGTGKASLRGERSSGPKEAPRVRKM